MTFKNSDNGHKIEVNILSRTEDSVEVELTCIDTKAGIEFMKDKITCHNIDSEGMNSMDFFDPSGEFNPVQVYERENEVGVIRIILPYEEVNKGIDYAGLEISEKGNYDKYKIKALLK